MPRHCSTPYCASHMTTACGDLRQASPSSWPPSSFAVASAAAAVRVTAPLLAATLLVAAPALTPAAPPGGNLVAVLLIAVTGLKSCLCYEPTDKALAQPASNGAAAALFRKACIGCHDMGGNILQPGATLFMKDLQRNGFDTVDEIYNITYYGKGRMPGFGEKCTPRGQCTFGPRLPEDDIKLLAEFVKSQAENGWPKIDDNGD